MTSYGWMLPFIIFYLVFWGLGKMSGWKELAEIYPLSSTDSDTENKNFWLRQWESRWGSVQQCLENRNKQSWNIFRCIFRYETRAS